MSCGLVKTTIFASWRRVSVFYIFYLHIIFIFNVHIYFYISSSEPVQTDSTPSSLNPRFFYRHFYFRCLLEKKIPYHTKLPYHTKQTHFWSPGCGGCGSTPQDPVHLAILRLLGYTDNTASTIAPPVKLVALKRIPSVNFFSNKE
jgi:hypothetical protein